MTATTGRATTALPTLRDASLAADVAYRDAVYTAHLAGATYAELADTLGVSRQAVRQLIARRKANDPAEKQTTDQTDKISPQPEQITERETPYDAV